MESAPRPRLVRVDGKLQVLTPAKQLQQERAADLPNVDGLPIIASASNDVETTFTVKDPVSGEVHLITKQHKPPAPHKPA